MLFDWDKLGIEVGDKESGRIKTLCPQCSHTRKNKHERCLSVDTGNGFYKCHHCGWLGQARSLAGGESWRRPMQAEPKAYTRPNWNPSGDSPQEAVDWLANRGIPAEVVKRNGIEWGQGPGRDGAQTDWLMFPYFRNGECVNVKLRSKDKEFKFFPGAELVLYGLDDVQEGEPLIWVEGEIDKHSFEAIGERACVSVPNGAPAPDARNYEREFAYLESAWPIIQKASYHIIAVDSDGPGKALEQELIRRLGPESCFTITWPEDVKDANECLIKRGPKGLGEVFSKARPVPISGIKEVSEVWDQVCLLYEHGLPGGQYPGWDNVADFYNPKLGQITLVTGIPSHGKSVWLDNLLVNIANAAGWQFAYFSPENHPVERHIANLMEIYTGQPFGPNPYAARMDLAGMVEAGRWVHDHFTFILPEDDAPTVDEILASAKSLILRRGIKGMVIDPWNEIDHTRPAYLSETEYISKTLSKIRRFARIYNIHIWIVAHPRILQKGNDGLYPVPTPYDVSGSAHWRNKPDFCISVYRLFPGPGEPIRPTQIHIQKVRFKECGAVGMAELYFDRVCSRYTEFPITYTPIWEPAPPQRIMPDGELISVDEADGIPAPPPVVEIIEQEGFYE